ncbi:hypothetical protein [Bartonella doshiae]|uniref:Lipoprotein n=2 Tax=Bartonella doshiae TaxID=33044 RepID=A0A380ZI87_BARDO|nr:hypothetical protein [Bartonella doshiae]EJF81867.1 hypothetical protein MCS_00292 [Bartonella doshiae NCTC 12862 = ATCC 700133]MBB6159946.1 hypothetical protein [Bartonella doshiae]SUV44706.1 Uncharacterised protein [Bartonella doshiae]
MKKILKLLSCIALLSIAGCEYKAEVPLSAWELWDKPGANTIDIGKALLECGMPTPYNRDEYNRKLDGNANALIEACMVQAGFRYKSGYLSSCEFFDARFPICHSGALIPQRSVKKRLNSPHCKRNRNKPECLP